MQTNEQMHHESDLFNDLRADFSYSAAAFMKKELQLSFKALNFPSLQSLHVQICPSSRTLDFLK